MLYNISVSTISSLFLCSLPTSRREKNAARKHSNWPNPLVHWPKFGQYYMSNVICNGWDMDSECPLPYVVIHVSGQADHYSFSYGRNHRAEKGRKSFDLRIELRVQKVAQKPSTNRLKASKNWKYSFRKNQAGRKSVRYLMDCQSLCLLERVLYNSSLRMYVRPALSA